MPSLLSPAQTAASLAQTNKDIQKAVKETLKSFEQDYRSTIRKAEKKCEKIRKEADKVFEQEKAIIKAQRDSKEKAAKEELGIVKGEAKDLHVHLVLEAVRNSILDLKTRNLLANANANAGSAEGGELARANSVSTTHSSSSLGVTSAQAAAVAASLKEEAEVKEWVEIAAERLEMHMSKSQTRQRILEEVASEALLRQYQAQQDADRRTRDLQRQIEHLQMLQLQHQQSLRQQQQQKGGEAGYGEREGDVPPPAYIPVGVGEYDYSQLKKK
jgi:hypothetical protein